MEEKEGLQKDKYRIKRVLGKGARGTVYLAENRTAGTLVAVKEYDGEDGEFCREAEAMRLLKGKGIPYLVDVFSEAAKRYIVMEYVEGRNLRAVLKERGVLPEAEALSVAADVADALLLFHGHHPQMIYGDLKPENIMITPAGSAYLVDFGSVLTAGQRSGEVFGTRAYLPKESAGSLLPYKDTYALGMILYEMLTGCPLQEGMGNGKADLVHLQRDTAALLQKAVKLSPQEGYGDAAELLEALKEIRAQRDGEGRKKRMKKRKKERNDMKNRYIADRARLVLTGGRTAGSMVRGILLCALFSLLLFGGRIAGGAAEAAGEMATDAAETAGEVAAGCEKAVGSGKEELQALMYESVCVEAEIMDGKKRYEKNYLTKEEPRERDEHGRKLLYRR